MTRDAAQEMLSPRAVMTEAMPRQNDVRIAIVSSSHLIRESLHALLQREPHLVITSSIAFFDWSKLASAPMPDIVLIQRDSESCGPLYEVMENLPEAKLILIEAVPSELDLVGCIQSGVAAFTLKEANANHLMSTIHAVAAGRRVMPQAVIDRLCAQLVEIGKNKNRYLWASVANLTPMERQVVRLVLDGLSNKEIGTKLSRSSNTVKYHIRNVMKKVKIKSRVDLVNYVWRSNQLPSGTPLECPRPHLPDDPYGKLQLAHGTADTKRSPDRNDINVAADLILGNRM